MSKLKIILPLFVLSMVMSSCEVQEVSLSELTKVELTKVENTEMHLDVTAVIENPNSFKINVSGSDLDLYLEDRYIGKTTLENTVVLKAKSNDAHDLKVKAKGENLNAELLPIMLSAALTGKVRVKLTGEVKGKVFLISKSVPVQVEEVVEFSKRQ